MSEFEETAMFDALQNAKVRVTAFLGEYHLLTGWLKECAAGKPNAICNDATNFLIQQVVQGSSDGQFLTVMFENDVLSDLIASSSMSKIAIARLSELGMFEVFSSSGSLSKRTRSGRQPSFNFEEFNFPDSSEARNLDVNLVTDLSVEAPSASPEVTNAQVSEMQVAGQYSIERNNGELSRALSLATDSQNFRQKLSSDLADIFFSKP